MPLFFRDGFRFWFETIGDGRPIVLGHGLTADVEQIKQLVGEISGWRLIVWDCRGHGQTEPDPNDAQIGFNLFAEDLAALLDHLSIKRAVIGGLSMGAGVAARFAADRPDRTEALVLMRPAWTDQPHPPGLELIERFGRVLQERGPEQTLCWIEANDGLERTPEVLEGLRQQCAKPRAQERAARLTAMPAQAPISAARSMDPLAQLPAMVTYCQEDPLHPADTARWWARQLPCAILRELPLRSAPDDAHRLAVRQTLAEFLAGL